MKDHIESQIMIEYMDEYSNLVRVATSLIKRINIKRDESKLKKIYSELNKYKSK